MDEKEKARIRKKATARFWQSVIVLALFPLLALWVRHIELTVEKSLEQLSLVRETDYVLDAFWGWYWNTSRELIPFEPPGALSERGTWAEQIESHLGMPVAVFIQQGSMVTWVRRPSNLGKATDEVEKFFWSPPAEESKRGWRGSSGCMELSHKGFTVDSAEYDVYTVGKTHDSLRWGVLSSYRDAWRGFFKQLDVPYGTVLSIGGPAWLLHDRYALPCSAGRADLTPLRATLDGEVIFASPKLDTTAVSYAYTDPRGPRIEHYLSWQPVMSQARWLINVTTAWLVLFPLVMIAPIYRWYRQVRKLTEPNTIR